VELSALISAYVRRLLWTCEPDAGISSFCSAWESRNARALPRLLRRTSRLPQGVGLPGRIWKSKGAWVIPTWGLNDNFRGCNDRAREHGLEFGFRISNSYWRRVLGSNGIFRARISSRQLTNLLQTVVR